MEYNAYNEGADSLTGRWEVKGWKMGMEGGREGDGGLEVGEKELRDGREGVKGGREGGWKWQGRMFEKLKRKEKIDSIRCEMGD